MLCTVFLPLCFCTCSPASYAVFMRGISFWMLQACSCACMLLPGLQRHAVFEVTPCYFMHAASVPARARGILGSACGGAQCTSRQLS